MPFGHYRKAKTLLAKSVSRPVFYKVILPSRFIGGATNEYLEYFARAIEIPEVRVEAYNVRGHTDQGIVRTQPTAMIWGKPFRIEVIENADFTVHRDFKAWMNRHGQNANSERGEMRMNYFNTIVGDIEIQKLELPDSAPLGSADQLAAFSSGEYKKVLSVKLIDGYIKALGAVRLASDATNQMTTFAAEFEYTRYVTEY